MSENGFVIVQLSQFYIMNVDAQNNTRQGISNFETYGGSLASYRFFSSVRAQALHAPSSSSPFSSMFMLHALASSVRLNSFALRAHCLCQSANSLAGFQGLTATMLPWKISIPVRSLGLCTLISREEHWHQNVKL